MQEWLTPYAATILALGAVGGLFLVQLVVADIAGIASGHAPGTPVAADPTRFLFRATRAHANTNESVAIFVLLALFGILSAASPTWLNATAWVYVAARGAHMACYYVGTQVPRSAAFGVALLALAGMLVVGLAAWS